MSKQTTYTDPAYARVAGSQSTAMVRSYFALMLTLIGGMMFDLVAFFYANLTWGALIGIVVGGLGAAGIVSTLAGYYWFAVMIPVSAGLNMSSQLFDLPGLASGSWFVQDKPLTEISMDPEERKMPVRIPVGIFKKKTVKDGEQVSQTGEGLTMIEEVHGVCPDCHHNVSLDSGEIYHRLPFLEFETFAYVMTPAAGSAPFQQAVIVSPCKIDSLRQIQDLIFFKGMPVMARTTYVSLTRIFEMDQEQDFGAPMYVVSFSTWHVELAQRLAGFTPAYIVPNLERIVQIYNLWGITEAMKLKQQLATAKSRIDSLEANQPEFRMALEAGIAHERKQEELIDMFPRTTRTRWLQPKYLALIAAMVIGAVIVTYLMTTGFKVG